MLKSEVQHQFWVTKKVVERKLGTKEDECIVSSDAELDAKIELFKTISDSCSRLHRIIDQYQERLCILAQEENALGKFLKETGKNSNTSGKVMICTGKAISYCGQQRMTIRPSLLRLFHEVETFRGRAVADTHTTIMNMERERTEYRAALSWMKSASSQLDPDTGKGLEKFRKAQTHVRLSKAKFDRLSLDCLQKIDLLAAARCNMFSHVLIAYMSALLQFATKSAETFKATAQALSANTSYNFCVLKDLADSIQQEDNKLVENNDDSANANAASDIQDIVPIDSDQMLFFLDEYTDDKANKPENSKQNKKENLEIKQKINNSNVLIEISSTDVVNECKEALQLTTDLLDSIIQEQSPESNLSTKSKDDQTKNLFDLSSNEFDDFISENSKISTFMPSQLLDDFSDLNPNSIFEPRSSINNRTSQQQAEIATSSSNEGTKLESTKRNAILDFFNRPSTTKNSSNINNTSSNLNNTSKQQNQQLHQSKKDISSWFDLFADLDPLANPDAIERKIDGGKENSQAA